MNRWFLSRFFTLSLLMLAACGANPTAPPATPAPPTPANTGTDATTPTPEPQPRLLVWTVDGAAGPGTQGASNPGQLALIDTDGALSPLMDVPDQTRTVQPCGTRATSPDGTWFLLYAGIDDGTLYAMENDATPTAVDTVASVTCLGEGSVRFSPDSTRLGYIDYEPGSGSDAYITGTLKVRTLADNAVVIEEPETAAFDMTATLTAYVNFFRDDQGRIDEAAVQINEGGVDREVTTLRPDENCAFVSASVEILPDTNLSLVMGQRCPGAGSTWQFYVVNPIENSATLGASDETGGGYQSFARTNTQIVVPGAESVLFTAPDGFTANTATLYRMDLDTMAATPLIESQAVMPSTTPPENSVPVQSPDGRWLAVVETTPNNENTLRIFDLNDITLAPITVDGGGRGDVFSAIGFDETGSTLYAVLGADDNALVRVNLSSGANNRLERGHFNNTMVVYPDGSQLAVGNTLRLEDENEPPYLNLVLIETENGAETTLFEGAVIADGKVQSQSFAVPLAWR